ncbi:colicin E1 family microcin immunity protein [Pantoea sp. USHLN298]|uniref:colicin E1 family microcin immunity protein n=1 Tax=Pantoea sp. USHLN298 TaxID=3081294 RepID=UPI00301B68D1
MKLKYYLINLLIGLIGVLALGKGWYGNPADPINQRWMAFAIVSWLAFPFAKFAIESIALKFTDESFWHRGFLKTI